MVKLYQWTRKISLIVGFVVLLGSVVWAERKQTNCICQGIDIAIVDTTGHHFLQESTLLTHLNKLYPDPIVGSKLQQIGCKKIENSIKSHNFVRACSVYKNWKGRLKIQVVPKRPIARIVCNDKPDQYIDDRGEMIPLSTNYTARVVLINEKNLCNINQYLKESPYGFALFQLLYFIDQDPFWRAQINYIGRDEKGKLTLATQLGKAMVVLGKPENIKQKMEKLKLFYQVILPYQGWNTYKRVNLEFDNQIVCE